VNYLVIGNSTAAVGAVEGIRSVDPEGKITLLAAEPDHTYSRPLISYLLAGKVTPDRLDYRPADFYEKFKVEAKLGQEVVAVDIKAHTVATRGGEKFSYDKLIIATGGRPFVPEIAGLSGARGVFTFTAVDDARRIDQYLKEQAVKEAVVLGGGMIGLKAAEALIARGLQVAVVELADRLLSTSFDRPASELLEAAIERRHAAVCLGTTVEKVVTTAGAVSAVRLTGGGELSCQLLIVAIGVVPNVEFLKASGLKLGRGLIVDDHLRTSSPDVYAAGDVVEGWDFLAEKNRPLPILPLACRQGRIAGRNMAGRDESYLGGMPMNAIEICDLPTISVGLTTVSGEPYEVLSVRNPERRTYRKVVLRENKIVGLILVGDIDRAGIFTGLIENKIDVGPIKHLLLSEEFGLLSLDSEYRKHMVSGPGIEV
jgi:NAD(P)H-nitrite reductase large subunit